MFIFGTRPEAIKMAPVIRKITDNSAIFEPVIVVTAQHREMLDQILALFKIRPSHDLRIMQENQSIEDVVVRCLNKLSEIILSEKPAMVLVQGDTTTTFVGALAAYYNKVTVGHLEAGLRTNDKFQPFPEEINRKLTTVLTDFHFAPTKSAAENLRNNGIPPNQIFVTGNTVIDALLDIVGRKYTFEKSINNIINRNTRFILVTAHRRDNFGKPLKHICIALKEIVQKIHDIEIIFPVHPNPKVVETVYRFMNNNTKIHLLSPLDYQTFVHVMDKSHLILTDSGGVQEEAPSLGKPVLVLRNKTERPEAIEAGTVKLVGTDSNKIISEALDLLTNEQKYNQMARAINPYGDGKASQRISNIISDKIN
jgi:UDP-N-acetylglucosamine 2-epimerase (non-hydrolysing)